VATHAEITDKPLDASRLLAALEADTAGAVLLFEGRVRGQNEGRCVVRLTYDAYRAMAEKVLAEIVREAGERWDVSGVGAVHRVGALDPGETSVAVVVAAAHRNEAYAASRFVIEEIKRRLPVWKRELYADGGARWLKGTPVGP